MFKYHALEGSAETFTQTYLCRPNNLPRLLLLCGGIRDSYHHSGVAMGVFVQGVTLTCSSCRSGRRRYDDGIACVSARLIELSINFQVPFSLVLK